MVLNAPYLKKLSACVHPFKAALGPMLVGLGFFFIVLITLLTLMETLQLQEMLQYWHYLPFVHYRHCYPFVFSRRCIFSLID